MPNHPNRSIREQAIRFCAAVLRHANDRQATQRALIDHPRFGPWLKTGGDEKAAAQEIIREAEKRLGETLHSKL